MHRLRMLAERAWGRLLGADPGLIRLRSAGRTTVALAVVLAVLALLAAVAGQPSSGVMVGALVAMAPALSPPDLDPRHRRFTTVLLVAVAATTLSAGALLAPHRLAGGLGLVLVSTMAFYVQRFGSRGTVLGTGALLAYFAALVVGPPPGQLPWLVTAVAVGAGTGHLVLGSVLLDRPDRVLPRTLAAFQVRVGAVVDAVDDAVRAGRADERLLGRLRTRSARLNETALTVHGQLTQHRDDTGRPLDVDVEQLLRVVFDAELAAERLGSSAERVAATVEEISPAVRARLHDALEAVGTELQTATNPVDLTAAGRRAAGVLDIDPGSPSTEDGDATEDVRRLALALHETAGAVVQLHLLAASPADRTGIGDGPVSAGEKETVDERPKNMERPAGEESPDTVPTRLGPSTRRAIQVGVATSLAIVAGNLLSATRWYWAFISALVIFLGTESSGQTLARGWQRLLGTVLGLAAGVVLATAVRGDTVASLVLVVAAFYLTLFFMQAGYAVSVFFSTVLLALVYGLLGEFSVDVLVDRFQETAVGATIGVLVALVVLPSSTAELARGAARDFTATLADLVGSAAGSPLGKESSPPLTEQTAELTRRLHRLRTVAAPMTSGVTGLGGRHGARRALEVLTNCSHYARTLAGISARPAPSHTRAAVQDDLDAAARHVQENIAALGDLIAGRTATVSPADDLLDRAEQALRARSPEEGGRRVDHDGAEEPGSRELIAIHTLRRLDAAVTGLARDLGAKEPAGRRRDAGSPEQHS
ncbi:FUSC family protein [Blastococcus mobilis]|uniref:Uncharacterized membrane protein YccC n=1 Tax=Blastococcus mobilis TaxID=1938746 RepID=A0A238UT55_9ACTN|nr:FUSC family protein [Blastococcus mobilis]SNR25196.1 Uncharacterized membrane protein YccC [Blastococcus mobilis]